MPSVFGTFLLALIQSTDVTDGQTVSPAFKAVITNAALVPDSWIVFEAELYMNDCGPDMMKVTPTSADNVVSNGNRREFPKNIGANVFDGKPQTSWVADCKAGMGGCVPYANFVGLGLTSTAQFQKAVGVNATNADRAALDVKCVRLFQSDNWTSKADKVAVQMLTPGVACTAAVGAWNGYCRRTVYEFDASGGDWTRGPMQEGFAWRVRNLEPTLGRFALSELRFYADDFCTFEIRGDTLSLTTRDKGINREAYILDGDTSTSWMAGCDMTNTVDTRKGCLPDEGWIGMYFQYHVDVRCMKLFQRMPNFNADVAELNGVSLGIGLDVWNGFNWLNKELFYYPDINFTVQGRLPPIRTMPTPFFGFGPGAWEDTRPPDYSAWRLVGDAYIWDSWRVNSIEFYTNPDCVAVFPEAALVGRPVSVQGPFETMNAALAFDDDIGQDTYWESSCTGFVGNGCKPGQAWIGLYFRGNLPQVKCFRLLQSNQVQHSIDAVALSPWGDGQWQIGKFHAEMGGGCWNRRPAPPWSMWRVISVQPTLMQWRLTEVRAYSDPLCLHEVYQGPDFQAIGSGYRLFQDRFERAFDSDSTTSWGADCLNCSKDEHWIGAQLPNTSSVLENGENLVRCLKFWQVEEYQQQSTGLRVDIWNGDFWTVSPCAPGGLINGDGSMSWSRQPTPFGGRWRLVSRDGETKIWRVSEIAFYRDSACNERLRSPHLGTNSGGASMLVSSYVPQFDIAQIAALTADGVMLFSETVDLVDGNSETSVLVDHRPTSGFPGWVGVDLLSEVDWVRCVRFMQSSLLPDQSRTAVLEWWDGSQWTSTGPQMSQVETVFSGLAGSGWSRRPAEDGTIWRIENLDYVASGWALHELEFHEDSSCGGHRPPPDVSYDSFIRSTGSGLVGEAIASGFVPPMDLNSHEHAFDHKLNTSWYSQCGDVLQRYIPAHLNKSSLPVGCNPRDAWIGLDLGQSSIEVKCFRVRQVGDPNYQSGRVQVAKWNGEKWTDVWAADGLGGSVWDQRPAFPNTMWRVVYSTPFKKRCHGDINFTYVRSWGIKEFQLFSDEACTQQIKGGRPIGSGTVEFYTPTRNDPASYAIDGAVDGDLDTQWGANCGAGWRSATRSRISCHGAFLGLDFGDRAVEVRCMTLMQARNRAPTCCDVASEVEIHRWNGSSWVEATWLHNNPGGYQFMEKSRQLGAHFVRMGTCLREFQLEDPWDAKIWEQRSRRDSDNCMIPLPGSTTLLGDKACVTNSRCSDIIGAAGDCCPMGTSTALSREHRCCCSFLAREPIFAEETNPADVRALLQIEYATVMLAQYLPIPGFIMFILFTVLVWILPETSEYDLHAWAHDAKTRRPCLRKFLYAFVWPATHWRSFMSREDALIAKICQWFIFPNGRPPPLKKLPRVFLWLVIGIFVGSVAPYLGLGLFLAQISLHILFHMCLSIRWSKSRYDPSDRRDMKLREVITKTPLKEEGDVSTGMDVSREFVSGILMGVGYFLKFTFDLLVTRAQMIALSAIDSIDAGHIVDIFPGLTSYLREPAQLMYDVLRVSSEVMSATLSHTIGIPLCQGTTVLYASVFLVATLCTASMWQNYDFFGLFSAAKQVCKTTLPECQRSLAMGLNVAALAMTFGMIQCSMILFARTLTMANPFSETIWMCAYDDTAALVFGRTLIMGASLVGVIVFFLTVNGHFLGQDYILRPIGEFLRLNFEALDPDGVGEDGGVVRFDVMLSLLPTIPGVYLDNWNVSGYLVKERAAVYAQQLRDPQVCVHCGLVHVKYNLLMVATGRQVSLACQFFPFGILAGKAAEYSNDPPMFYMGKALPCASYTPFKKPRGAPGIRTFGLERFLMRLEDILCYSLDYINPIGRRVVSVILYLLLLMGTFTITEDNLVDRGPFVISSAFTFCMLKAFLENFIEALVTFFIGVLHEAIHLQQGTYDRSKDVKRTLVAQILVGSSCAAATSSVLSVFMNTSYIGIFVLSWFIGYVVSLLALILALALESDLTEEVKPTISPGPTLAKIGFALAIAAWVCLLAYQGIEYITFRGMAILPIPVVGIQMAVMMLLFVEKRYKPEIAVVKMVLANLNYKKLTSPQHSEVHHKLLVLLEETILGEISGPRRKTIKHENVTVKLCDGDGTPVRVEIQPGAAFSGAKELVKALGKIEAMAEVVTAALDSMPDLRPCSNGEFDALHVQFSTEKEPGIVNPAMSQRASPARKVLFSRRLGSSCVATFAASAIGIYVRSYLSGHGELAMTACVMAHLAGVFGGFFVGMSIDKILENYAQLFGVFMFVAVGYVASFWNLLGAIIIAAFIGAIMGGIIEEYEIRQLIADDKLKRAFLEELQAQRAARMAMAGKSLGTREERLVKALKYKEERVALAMLEDQKKTKKKASRVMAIDDDFSSVSYKSSRTQEIVHQSSKVAAQDDSRESSNDTTLRQIASALDDILEVVPDPALEEVVDPDIASLPQDADQDYDQEQELEATVGLEDNCNFERGDEDDQQVPLSEDGSDAWGEALSPSRIPLRGSRDRTSHPMPIHASTAVPPVRHRNKPPRNFKPGTARVGGVGALLGATRPSLAIHRSKLPPANPSLRHLHKMSCTSHKVEVDEEPVAPRYPPTSSKKMPAAPPPRSFQRTTTSASPDSQSSAPAPSSRNKLG